MKKYLVIPLLFFYALSISGLTVHAHYCGKHLVSWGLFAKGKDCGTCEKKMSCCKDKVVSLKVSHDQKNVSSFQFKSFHTNALIPQTTIEGYKVKFLHTSIQSIHYSNAPPGLWQDIPLYKLNSSLTYYS